MFEALRGLGYSTAGALADIIDNSISAKASDVCLTFLWEHDRSRIAILDNGCGMDEDTLERGMRLGTKNPLHARASTDLGRFGMGLKTASFSQCRRLTVASKRDDRLNAFQWDLDVLASGCGEWHLLEGAGAASGLAASSLNALPSGTLVVWDQLDRIVTSGCTAQTFLDMIDVVETHLAMVFHRYLAGNNPRLRLRINDRRVAAWDPFILEHAATWSSPSERIQTSGACVEVQAHVLPHKDRLTPTQHEHYAGPDGWTAQQGFYVYRNERLLVAGNWLGLGQTRPWTKEEAFRLARIRLDISNAADSDWKIDIRKATARPPIGLRKRLISIAEDARQRGRRVFAHRGGIVRGASLAQSIPLWRSEQSSSGVRYRIQKEHPVVRNVLDDAGELTSQVITLLRLIEETIPVQRIWLDTAEAKETPLTRFAGEPPSEVLSVLISVYRNFVKRRGLSPKAARERLLHTEPFQDFPSLVLTLPEDPDEKKS